MKKTENKKQKQKKERKGKERRKKKRKRKEAYISGSEGWKEVPGFLYFLAKWAAFFTESYKDFGKLSEKTESQCFSTRRKTST